MGNRPADPTGNPLVGGTAVEVEDADGHDFGVVCQARHVGGVVGVFADKCCDDRAVITGIVREGVSAYEVPARRKTRDPEVSRTGSPWRITVSDARVEDRDGDAGAAGLP